jgi:nucleotide-binding universal stress UspA family protein
MEVINMKPQAKNIVIAIDGSAGSRAAIDEGLGLAGSLGAEVSFLTVRPAPLPVLGDPYYQRALTKELGRARQALAEAVAVAEEQGIPCDAEDLEGNPADGIVTRARELDADVIVVGTRGLGPFKSALMGSVSTAVVHRADRPVLVARDDAEARARSAA